MTHYIERNHTVNADTGEVVRYSTRSVPKTYTNEKWSVIFFKSIEALADSKPSKTAMALFLYLLSSTGMAPDGELEIYVVGLAHKMDVAPTLIHRAVRELVELNVLMPTAGKKLPKSYRFNPRIVWYGKMDKRPVDLTPYPLIGAKQKHETTTSTTRSATQKRPGRTDAIRHESSGDAPGTEGSSHT